MKAQFPLEGVGVLFLNRRHCAAALVTLSQVVAASPQNSYAWYGIGNALLVLSTEGEAIPRLRLALSCLLRALEESPENRMAKELIEVIERRSPLTAEDRASCGAFDDEPLELPARVAASLDDVVRAFAALPTWQERMQVTMFIGDVGGPFFGPLMVSALNDAHSDVCMAALKRLRRFAAEPSLENALTTLVRGGRGRTLQPYSSMALRALVPQTSWAGALLEELTNGG